MRAVILYDSDLVCLFTDLLGRCSVGKDFEGEDQDSSSSAL